MSKQEEKQRQEQLEEMEERNVEEKQEDLLKENKMGTMPVGKLLFNVSIPIVISMLVQALYNVVDSIFVARLGEEALAAVGLAFPVQNLMIAVAVGTGVGISSRLGRRLGEQNADSANRVAMNGMFLGLLSSMAFALFGLFLAPWFFSLFATGEMAVWGTNYLRIVTIASQGVFMSIVMERLLQATGRSTLSMATQLTGAVVNIILDPIMIFGLLGFPAMGVAGAALATVVGQFCSMAVGFWCCIKKNPEIQMRFRGFRPSATTIRHIYEVGAPSIVMQSIGSVMTFGMNKILVGFGTTPVSVFSIYFKLQSFIFMPVFGFNNGMVPIVAFNYGAKNKHRIKGTVQLSCIVNFCIMVVGTLLFWLIPDKMLLLFDAQENMLAIGTVALRVISLSFPLAAISIVFTGLFQAVGYGVYSLVVSVIRQLVFLLPIAWLFARWHGLDTLWWAFPAAEVGSIFFAVYFFLRTWRNKISPLGGEVQAKQKAV